MKYLYLEKLHTHKLYFLLIIACLSGCNPYRNDFDCPLGDGMRCAPLSYVNKSIDRGRIDLNAYEHSVEKYDYEQDTLSQIEQRGSQPLILWVSPDSTRSFAHQTTETY